MQTQPVHVYNLRRIYYYRADTDEEYILLERRDSYNNMPANVMLLINIGT